jgi:hypothetical protein
MDAEESGAVPAHNAWWRRRHLLHRFVSNLITDELKRLRRSTDMRRPLLWPDDLGIDRNLGADSLEMMLLATALAESIHLHRSGIEDYLLVKHTVGDCVDIAHAGLEHFCGELRFRTSGSTGVPKNCIHPAYQRTVSIRRTKELYPSGCDADTGNQRTRCSVRRTQAHTVGSPQPSYLRVPVYGIASRCTRPATGRSCDRLSGFLASGRAYGPPAAVRCGRSDVDRTVRRSHQRINRTSRHRTPVPYLRIVGNRRHRLAFLLLRSLPPVSLLVFCGGSAKHAGAHAAGRNPTDNVLPGYA